ncbi:LysM peptidoglycan-binding domain-containing protein [Phototrophicus methaneseepsis]|uniref:LysM peptidoglycan-binding domain-containing protein n=1 Tax=Phototrophicus methaneseepsis TaxID=2710758 RepID=A0A7S8IDW2_9CHLR|nr:LysM peptidoglycan-binding domain-containing protein [Phototrophicus methaneseepsis]QPC81942.1 LysM peptidoglycan-binding domain-containing protein [Phototrophicus methaneseepsis]
MYRKLMTRVVLVMVLLVLGTQVVSAQDRVYIVQPGDTLGAIANHYGVPLNVIVSYNSIVNPSRIYAGQRLLIPSSWNTPAPAPSATQYVVKAGDTLKKIADWYGTTWQALASYNGIANANWIYAGMVIYIPSGGYVPPAPQPQPTPSNVYYVRYGDTMLRIANYFGVNVWRLAEANGIYNLNRIYAGQRLVIP